jgi:hypothetical protein
MAGGGAGAAVGGAGERRASSSPAEFHSSMVTRPCLKELRLPFGAPGDRPPCIRQRPFGIAGDRHRLPFLVRPPRRPNHRQKTVMYRAHWNIPHHDCIAKAECSITKSWPDRSWPSAPRSRLAQPPIPFTPATVSTAH